MSKKNTGKSYEELVREIYQAILDYENADVGYKRIEVQHNVELMGKTGNLHQIDVYWSFELAGIEYKTLVEVKDWKSPVKKEQLHSFKTLLDDIPGFPRGCFVSKSGFQKGAEIVAKHHGIKLIKIEEAVPSLTLITTNIVTYYDGAILSVDEEWFEKENISDEDLRKLSEGIAQEDAILLNPKQIKMRLYDLMCRDAVPYYYDEDSVYHTVEIELDGDWYWLTENPNIPKVKITKYEFKCHNQSATSSMELGLPRYLITDILTEKKHLYDAVAKTIKLNLT